MNPLSLKRVRPALMAAALVTLSAGVLPAQTTAPGTPSGSQLVQWLAAFNAGDRGARQQFYKDHWAYSPNQNFYEDLLDQTGGFELLRIEESTPTRTIAIARQIDGDAVARLTLEVEPDAPHRIVRFTSQGIPRPADLPIVRVTEEELLKTLRAELGRRAAADRFSGTVLVAKNGTPIFTAAYGLANRERAIPIRLDTRLKNGSMNKMFTATAAVTLVQSGKLALDAPLGKYLTDYPNAALASKVTIHHLLTHTGGTGDFFGAQFTAHRMDLKTHKDYVALFGKRDLFFEPGSQWSYSNYGFILLGAVIERVSGQSYFDYVRDHVYKPAGMTSTGSEPEDQVLPNTAVGYTKRAGSHEWQANTDSLGYRAMAAGGGFTTVEDLLRFATALTGNRLLSAENTRLLTTGKVKSGAGQYAYGFVDTTVNGVRVIGHSGGAPGQSGDLLILPESGYVVAALSNLDPPAAPRITNYVASRLPAR
jgi:CubicO group peptidase (beta-lactamase class C family)